MPFYDLHIHTSFSIGENSVEEIAEMAKRLGFAGIGIARYYSGSSLDELPKVDGIDIINSVILMVHGVDYDINRAACENPMIDVLCHPELGRRDSGLDHICVKSAADNNVAIEINFREVLESYKRHRVYVLSSIKKNAKLCTKYDTPIITNSGAVNKWSMRSGRELASVTNLIGIELGAAIASVSETPERIVRINREKIAGRRWEGVEIVNEKV